MRLLLHGDLGYMALGEAIVAMAMFVMVVGSISLILSIVHLAMAGKGNAVGMGLKITSFLFAGLTALPILFLLMLGLDPFTAVVSLLLLIPLILSIIALNIEKKKTGN